MQAWQSGWDEFNTRLNQSSQSAQVERTRIDQIEKQLLQLVQRIEKSTLESSQLDSQQLENDISGLSSQVDGHRQQADSLQKSLDTLRARIDELRTTTRTMQEQLHESQNQQQEVRGRLASLQALQQAALGENGGVVNKWLESQGLGEATRLAKQLSVEAGWERAVETVLGFYLEAVCVDNSTELLSELANLTQGSLAIVDSGGQAESNSTNKASPLTDKVSAPWSLDGLLAGVYIADSLQEAMSIRSQLAAHESIVTQDGIWLGNGWLRVARDADQKAGVLEREREIKELSSKVEVITEESKQITTQLETGRSDLQEAEASRDGLQAEVNQAHRKFSDTKAQLESRNSRLDQLRKRKVSLDNELEELVIQQGQDLEIVSTARSVLNTALTSLDSLASDRESRLSQRDELRSALDQLRQEAQRDRDNAHALELKYRSLHTEQETKDQNLSRMKNQQEHLKLRRDELLQALSECETPFKEMQDELAIQLKSRVSVEEELTGKRKRVEDIDHQLREQEQSRHTREQQSQQLREQLGQLKLSWQEIKVRGETILEQVTESGFELATLVEELAEDAVLADWESTVEQVTNRIQKLGPINLAAIEEFDEQSERKNYLDAQHLDVTSALETLESAIRKIDRETRTRFKETYDKVNSGLQAMFPRLFGGGHAYLELTGEDLLDTGVTVMARPPGKRNSTIHLLSGGEKALTAVAMIFAIFELNPSPFCMLDEVDAPLDDANVGRFCNLVREMSDRVQFIFITHNKITMDIASQLMGVTMHEAGVSRLVSVDVDEAVQLAAV